MSPEEHREYQERLAQPGEPFQRTEVGAMWKELQASRSVTCIGCRRRDEQLRKALEQVIAAQARCIELLEAAK